MHSATDVISSEGEIIRRALGEQWQTLHPDIQNRFNKNPAIGKPLRYHGKLERLDCSFIGKILGYLTKPFIKGALLPYRDENFPVDIQVYSKKNSPYLFKHRIYQLNHRRAVEFISYMEETPNGDILEYVGAGLGMKLKVFSQDGNLHFRSAGYFWDIGLCRIPIPSLFTPGKTFLSHINEGPNQFRIRIDMKHILFGMMYVQTGVFHETLDP